MSDPCDARTLVRLCGEKGLKISTAESCTGGYLSSRITDVPGSSSCYMGGVVTYSNESKESLLGVRKETLALHGAVSRETAIEMATGCMGLFDADLSVSLTGIAGPTGGTKEKSVGRLFIAVSSRWDDPICEGFNLGSIGRGRFKCESSKRALGMMIGRARGFGSADPML